MTTQNAGCNVQGAKFVHAIINPHRSSVKRRWKGVIFILCLALVATTFLVYSPQLRRKRWQQMSIERLRQEASRRPNDAEAHLLLGLRLRRKGDAVGAFEEIFRAYNLRRTEPRFMAAMAAAHMDAGDDAGAADLLRSASVRAPNAPEVLAQQAHLQLKHGRFADALRNARKAVKLGPRLPEAWQALGRACAVEKLTDEAYRAYARALELSPDDVEILTDCGEALARYGRFKEAEATLRRALRIAPRAPRSLGLLGAQLAARARRSEERKEAADILQRAIDAAPRGAEQRYHLGMLQLREGRAENAIQQLKTCLELNPRYGEAHDGLGRACALLGRDKEAREHFAAFQRYTDYRREATHFELRLRRAPRDLNLLLRMARLHEDYDATRWAVVYYHRALEVRPDAELERRVAALERKVSSEQ